MMSPITVCECQLFTSFFYSNMSLLTCEYPLLQLRRTATPCPGMFADSVCPVSEIWRFETFQPELTIVGAVRDEVYSRNAMQ